MRRAVAFFNLVSMFWVGLFAQGGPNAHTIPIRVSVDRQDHSVSYAIGKNAKLHITDPRISSELIALSKVEEGSVFIFLISNEAPFSELDTINYVVDKYDLTPARFFICDHRSAQMIELKRDTDELFRWTDHKFPISESPPPDQ